jgi:quinoprotein relay system zinc metallohydrolase 2
MTTSGSVTSSTTLERVRRQLVCCAAVIVSGAAAAGEALPVTEIAAGIHVHVGAQAEASPSNHGAIANIGFIVGRRCVAVIDTGGSPEVGRSLRAAVRQVTPLPVCYVVNTHVHPDHVLGNAAFVADRPEFVGHAKLAAAMAARGRVYLAAAKRALGPDAADAEIIPPTRAVTGSAALDLGDRTLELRAWPTAHTDHDLTVFDGRTGTLWLSDLLFIERIPVVDGSLRGWLQVLADLQPFTARLVVPGHGKVTGDWPGASAAQERYLRALLSETRAALRARKTLQEAVETIGAGGHDRWLLFDAFHRRNVTAAFAELEWEE